MAKLKDQLILQHHHQHGPAHAQRAAVLRAVRARGPSERIGDKVAASKKKGMWMGGPVPLGYEVKERKLIIYDEEAETVRHIFRRYAELGTGQKLLDELREHGFRTKRSVLSSGKTRGDIPFTRGSLFHLLGNRIYRGEMVHKGKPWPGEHQAIIDVDLWAKVQQQIEDNRIDRKTHRNAREAMSVREEVLAAPDQTISGLAVSTGRCRKRLAKLLAISWLAPEIVETILAGRQPAAMTAKVLVKTDLPLAWSDQKTALGLN